jgi:hypothetical protein
MSPATTNLSMHDVHAFLKNNFYYFSLEIRNERNTPTLFLGLKW